MLKIHFNKQSILLIICITILFILTYILNYLYPIHGEDWQYAFIWGTDNRVGSIADIIKSQYNHYMSWTGRVITHSIDQLLLMEGKFWINIFNSIAYISFVFIIYHIINLHKQISAYLFCLVALGLWFCLPNFTATTIWITYSANYLWGTSIVLLFIFPYYKYYTDRRMNNNSFFPVLMILYGIIAGWTNENSSICLISFISILFLYFRYNKIKIPRWAIFGLLGVVIGCILLLLAPGNFVRANTGTAFIVSDDKYIMYARRLIVMYHNYISYLIILVIVYIVFLIVFMRTYKSDIKTNILFISFVFVAIAHIGFIVMIASPDFPERVCFPLVVFMIIGIGILYCNIDLKYLTMKVFNIAIIIILITYFCKDYFGKYTYLVYVNDFWNKREAYIENQRQKGITDIVFNNSLVHNKDFIFHELGEDPNGMVNIAYAKYYGIKSVKEIKNKE
ncbi:MAG: DUF6056 family protein [Dysgonomonas sp.]|nr:DUF6056 family protein [Dysgonomonas sp.]